MSALCNHSWCYSQEGCFDVAQIFGKSLLIEEIHTTLHRDVTVSLSAMISAINSHESQMRALLLNLM